MTAAAEVMRITWDGKTLTLREWSRVRSVFLLGITVAVIRERLAMGWDVERTLTEPATPRVTRGECSTCGIEVERPGSIARSRLRCESCHRLRIVSGAPVNSTTRFDQDEAAKAFVRVNPDGATFDDIGAALGVTRQRAHQIFEEVLPIFIRRCLAKGVPPEDLHEMLSNRLRGFRAEEDPSAREPWSELHGYYAAQRAEAEGPEATEASDLAQRVDLLLTGVEARTDFVEAITKRAERIGAA